MDGLLLLATVVGDVARHHHVVHVAVVADVVEDTIERHRGVVGAPSLRFVLGLEEVGVRELDDADRSVDAGSLTLAGVLGG